MAPAVNSITASPNLYVVGCGVLGTRVAKEWLERYPDSDVCGETVSSKRHDELRALGIRPLTREARPENDKYDSVLIATPPSAYADGEEYACEIEAAARLCDNCFVMISSGGVYAEDQGGVCSETSPVTASARAQKLLKAEAAALKVGAVIRLAGLYTLDRGAHVFWYSKTTVDANPDSLVNLLHYDDAATATVNALESRAAKGDILLVADGNPRSRQQIVNAAASHPKFAAMEPVSFTGEALNSRGPKGMGKVYDCSFTINKLQWTPKFATIEDFFSASASSS